MLARSKLNSIESKISEALINNEISHEDFITILNEETKYRELKENIRMMNGKRSDVDKKEVMLLKILNMMDIKEGLLLWFTIFLIKSRKVVVLIYH